MATTTIPNSLKNSLGEEDEAQRGDCATEGGVREALRSRSFNLKYKSLYKSMLGLDSFGRGTAMISLGHKIRRTKEQIEADKRKEQEEKKSIAEVNSLKKKLGEYEQELIEAKQMLKRAKTETPTRIVQPMADITPAAKK
jgi:seryl-tRNA synthetase